MDLPELEQRVQALPANQRRTIYVAPDILAEMEAKGIPINPLIEALWLVAKDDPALLQQVMAIATERHSARREANRLRTALSKVKRLK